MLKKLECSQKNSLWLLIPLLGFPQIGETIYTPCLPDMVQKFLTSPQLVNMSLSLYFVGFALGVLFFGSSCDRYGRRPSMLLGLGIYVCSSVLCVLSPNIFALLLSRLLQGFGASVGSVVTQTIMRDLYSGSRRSQVFSLVTAALALSPAVGPLVGGFVDQQFGFKGNFIILLLIGLVLLIASYCFLKETLEKVGQSKKIAILPIFKRMLLDPFIWKTVFVVAGANGILFSFYGEAPFVFQKILGYSPSAYGCIGFMVALSSICGALLSHRFNTKINSEKIVLFGAFFTVVGALVFLILASLGFINSSSLILSTISILFPMFFVLIGFGLMIPNSLSIALKSYSQNLGMAGACLGLMYYFFIALFTEGMGVLHDGTALAMPRYFLGLASFILVVCMTQPAFIRVKSFINKF